MGFWGLVFATVLLPAVTLCLWHRQYRLVGAVMLASWVLFILPVRELIPFGNHPVYFTAVTTICASLLFLFCRHLIVARIILATMALAVGTSYFLFSLGYVSLHQAMILSDLFGYFQIAAMYGGVGGGYIKRIFTALSLPVGSIFRQLSEYIHLSRRLYFMVTEWL